MVPIHTYWAGYFSDKGLPNSDLLQKDVRYPNEKGHEIFAEAIIQKLQRIIPDRRVKSSAMPTCRHSGAFYELVKFNPSTIKGESEDKILFPGK